MKNYLRIGGIIVAVAAVVVALAGANLGANHMPQDLHPNGSIGLGLAALALLKASELS